MSESRPAAPPGYRLSSTPSPPLSPAAIERMLADSAWESRAEVAGQDQLAAEHIARLVLDDVEAVRHMLYAVRRDIPQALLNDALARHPEDAAQIAFQQQAPLAALRVKAFNFATREDIERFLVGMGADARLAQRLRSLPKTPDNALTSLHDLLTSLKGTHEVNRK